MHVYLFSKYITTEPLLIVKYSRHRLELADLLFEVEQLEDLGDDLALVQRDPRVHESHKLVLGPGLALAALLPVHVRAGVEVGVHLSEDNRGDERDALDLQHIAVLPERAQLSGRERRGILLQTFVLGGLFAGGPAGVHEGEGGTLILAWRPFARPYPQPARILARALVHSSHVPGEAQLLFLLLLAVAAAAPAVIALHVCHHPPADVSGRLRALPRHAFILVLLLLGLGLGLGAVSTSAAVTVGSAALDGSDGDGRRCGGRRPGERGERGGAARADRLVELESGLAREQGERGRARGLGERRDDRVVWPRRGLAEAVHLLNLIELGAGAGGEERLRWDE
mmetsp:Transcript_21522/g.54619  ORF Transcript_21522/g.54619 Transcript_21522/m.54619 type:complete len:340 (-) Transcript_21522:889-1908(-)